MCEKSRLIDILIWMRVIQLQEDFSASAVSNVMNGFDYKELVCELLKTKNSVLVLFLPTRAIVWQCKIIL